MGNVCRLLLWVHTVPIRTWAGKGSTDGMQPWRRGQGGGVLGGKVSAPTICSYTRYCHKSTLTPKACQPRSWRRGPSKSYFVINSSGRSLLCDRGWVVASIRNYCIDNLLLCSEVGGYSYRRKAEKLFVTALSRVSSASA